jgi:hypothetical protein
MIAPGAPGGSVRQPWRVVTIVTAALACWMGLGSLHDLQHADSLLTVLISTQRWTPFFWGQDRFGMLVPLLAMPFRHPLVNMLAQGWMTTAGALLAPFVMARFLTGPCGEWMAIGACTNALLLWIATPAVQFDWLVAQPYGVSTALGFAALIAGGERDRPRDAIVALVLLALACWVNVSVIAILAIGAAVAGGRRVRLLTLIGVAAGIAMISARYGASTHTMTALSEPGQWLVGWRRLLEGVPGVTATPAAAIAVGGGVVLAMVWLSVTRRLPPWQPMAAIAAMAIGSWLIVGTSLWVGMNLYVFRYMYPTLMIAGVGASAVFVALFAKHTRIVPAVTLVAMAALATARYGTPSYSRVSRAADDRFGAHTAAILRSGATVIAGDYWRVWPAVFHANLALARTHAHTRVYGLAVRSDDTDVLWKQAGRQVLIAASPEDRSVEEVAGAHGLSVTLMTHLPELDLYTARP